MAGDKGEDVRYVFQALFFDIRECLSQITFRFNRDLQDNILLRGLPATTKAVMEKCDGKCKKACKRDKNPQMKDTK